MDIGSINQVIDALFDGHKLKMTFPNLGEYHTFRAKLFKHKKVHDGALIAAELIEPGQQKSLVIEVEPLLPGIPESTEVQVILSYKDKSLEKRYQFEILTEPEDREYINGTSE